MKADELLTIATQAMADRISAKELSCLLSTDSTLSEPQQSLVHLLIHYVTDKDLRDKDQQYDQYLRSQLNAILAGLK